MNLIRRSPGLHVKSLYPAVFDRVAKGFLQNAEETKSNGWRQVAWQIVRFADNLYSLLLTVLSAKSPDGSSQARDPILTSAIHVIRIGYQ